MKVQGFKRFVEDFDIELTTKTSEIIQIVDQMDSDELEDFGQWLYAEIYDEDSEEFTKEEVIEMVNELDSESLDYVLYMLSNDFEDDEDFEADDVKDDDVEDDEDDEKYFEKCLDEKRFFKIKKSALNRAKKINVAQRRKDKKAAKLNYRKHRAKIKLQNKKYAKKVKRNPNAVRTHR